MSWLGTSAAKGPPTCFGKSWEQQAPECAGGADPAFKVEKTDPRTGDKFISHVREPCGYFSECGSRIQASRMEQARQQLIPATSLVQAWQGRPQPPAAQPTQQNTQPGIQQFTLQSLQQQFEKMQKDYMQQQMVAMQRGQPPPNMMMPMQMHGPAPGFQQMMPVNFEIPQYLTVREKRGKDEGVLKMLGREVARSMLKSAGHTFANFFDSTAFYKED